MIPQSPLEKVARVTTYQSGKACKRGHDGLRYLRSRACVACSVILIAASRARNPESARAANARSRKARSEHRAAYAKRVRAERPEDVYAWKRRWEIKNKPKMAASAARRKAAKRNATPAWADKDLIEAVYREAAIRMAQTGVEHQVDHIVPLQGRTVCGLHVQTNLRVITRAENIKKYNRIDDAALLHILKGKADE